MFSKIFIYGVIVFSAITWVHVLWSLYQEWKANRALQMFYARSDERFRRFLVRQAASESIKSESVVNWRHEGF